MFGSLFRRKPFNSRETGSKSLNIERATIRANGGIPNKQLLGADGHNAFGRPMEVKYAGRDERFRVNRRDHLHMLAHNGIYIFVNERGQQIKLPASQVDGLIHYKWLHDRHENYDHGFVFKRELFG